VKLEANCDTNKRFSLLSYETVMKGLAWKLLAGSNNEQRTFK